jgi:hypothetical protein
MFIPHQIKSSTSHHFQAAPKITSQIPAPPLPPAGLGLAPFIPTFQPTSDKNPVISSAPKLYKPTIQQSSAPTVQIPLSMMPPEQVAYKPVNQISAFDMLQFEVTTKPKKSKAEKSGTNANAVEIIQQARASSLLQSFGSKVCPGEKNYKLTLFISLVDFR